MPEIKAVQIQPDVPSPLAIGSLFQLTKVNTISVAVRSSGAWNGMNLVNWIKQYDSRGAASLEFRFLNENLLVRKAQDKLLLGHGDTGKGQEMYEGQPANDKPITDGLWIITLGN